MWLFLLGAAWLLLDQGSKAWVHRAFLPGESFPVVPGYFHLTYVRNEGAAFGILQGQTAFFVAVTLAVLAAGLLYRRRIAQERLTVRLGCTLGLSGALGNLIDRVSKGWVVDFLDFRVFPVFNFADVAVVGGAALLVWSILSEGPSKGAVADEA